MQLQIKSRNYKIKVNQLSDDERNFYVFLHLKARQLIYSGGGNIEETQNQKAFIFNPGYHNALLEYKFSFRCQSG